MAVNGNGACYIVERTYLPTLHVPTTVESTLTARGRDEHPEMQTLRLVNVRDGERTTRHAWSACPAISRVAVFDGQTTTGVAHWGRKLVCS